MENQYRLLLIESGKDFWALLDEMETEKSSLFQKDLLVEAYKEECLYGLYSVNHCDFMCKDSFTKYLLPCLCIMSEKECIVLWTHSRARKKGLASTLIRLLEIKKAVHVLPESKDFWKNRKIPYF